MRKYKPIPTVSTSVRISPEYHELCYKYHIRFSEAMRVGISIMLAEKGVAEYDNNLNLVRQLNESIQKAQEYAKKAFDLENKQNDKNTKK